MINRDVCAGRLLAARGESSSGSVMTQRQDCRGE